MKLNRILMSELLLLVVPTSRYGNLAVIERALKSIRNKNSTVKAMMFFRQHALVKSRYDVNFLPRCGLFLSSLSRSSSTAKTKRPLHYKIKPLSSGQNITVVHKPSFTYIYWKTVPGKPYLIFKENNSWIPQHKVQTPFPSSKHASPTNLTT